MGSVCLLAAAGDVRMLVRGSVLGAKRITRHLWRMLNKAGERCCPSPTVESNLSGRFECAIRKTKTRTLKSVGCGTLEIGKYPKRNRTTLSHR